MKLISRFPWPVMALALGLTLALAGCGGGGSGSSSVQDYNNQIYAANQSWVNAVVNKNGTQLDQIVSPYFLNNGTNANGWLNVFDQIFADYDSLEMTVKINKITYDDNSLPSLANVLFDFMITGVRRSTGVRTTIFDSSTGAEAELIWRYEDGRWKQYGNQYSSGSGGLSAQPGYLGILNSLLHPK